MTNQNSKLNLTENKDITKFTDEKLFSWFKEYVKGWGGKDLTSRNYELVKAELERRHNERISNLTKKIHVLTVTLVVLTAILIILTGILLFK